MHSDNTSSFTLHILRDTSLIRCINHAFAMYPNMNFTFNLEIFEHHYLNTAYMHVCSVQPTPTARRHAPISQICSSHIRTCTDTHDDLGAIVHWMITRTVIVNGRPPTHNQNKTKIHSTNTQVYLYIMHPIPHNHTIASEKTEKERLRLYYYEPCSYNCATIAENTTQHHKNDHCGNWPRKQRMLFLKSGTEASMI